MSAKSSSFPEYTPVISALGFAFSASACGLWGGSRNVALMKGAMSATATLIEAATRPFTQAFLPDNKRGVALVQSVVPRLITCALALAIAPSLETSYTTNITTFAIFSVVTYIGVALVQRVVSMFFLFLATAVAYFPKDPNNLYQGGIQIVFASSVLGLMDIIKKTEISKDAMLFLF